MFSSVRVLVVLYSTLPSLGYSIWNPWNGGWRLMDSMEWLMDSMNFPDGFHIIPWNFQIIPLQSPIGNRLLVM